MNFQYKNSFNILIILVSLTATTKSQESCLMPNYENGFCVPYNECPLLMELANNFGGYSRIPQNYLDYIFALKCSKPGEAIRLCCKFSNFNQKPVTETTTPPVTQPPETPKVDRRNTPDLDYTKDYQSQFNQQGLNILKALSCGALHGNRIAGGNETELGEFPWMALLRYDSPTDEIKCGGSLITDRFVLTAAHCIKNSLDAVIGVRLGEYDLSTEKDCRPKGIKIVCNPPVEDIGVEDIIVHPKYNDRRKIYDIALLKLNRKVEFQKHIKPVCLPITPQSFKLDTDDFFIAGWGTTEKGVTSNVLLKAQVYRKDLSVCANLFRKALTQIHICAQDPENNRDSCRGDSGGPLVSLNTYTNVKRFVQTGIVASGGVACSLEKGFPGIYTNILSLMPWITSNIVE